MPATRPDCRQSRAGRVGHEKGKSPLRRFSRLLSSALGRCLLHVIAGSMIVARGVPRRRAWWSAASASSGICLSAELLRASSKGLPSCAAAATRPFVLGAIGEQRGYRGDRPGGLRYAHFATSGRAQGHGQNRACQGRFCPQATNHDASRSPDKASRALRHASVWLGQWVMRLPPRPESASAAMIRSGIFRARHPFMRDTAGRVALKISRKASANQARLITLQAAFDRVAGAPRLQAAAFSARPSLPIEQDSPGRGRIPPLPKSLERKESFRHQAPCSPDKHALESTKRSQITLLRA